MVDTFKGIPVRKEVVTLSEDERFCPDCETPLKRIGEEMVRREFRFTPAKGEVVEFYTETYKCPECTSGNTPEKSYEFVKAKAPEPLIPYSYASASSVAWIMYQKYANAMPLYRQEADWKQLGVNFSRATMANPAMRLLFKRIDTSTHLLR
jgi:transposase